MATHISTHVHGLVAGDHCAGTCALSVGPLIQHEKRHIGKNP
jgi:hypothetical protein